MKIKIVERPSHIPDSMLETIAFLHGAVDPDSGHLVCHHYPLGLTLVEAEGSKAPALSIGECIYLVPPPWSKGIARGAEQARIEFMGSEHTMVGKARVDTSSLSLVLSLLREEKADARVMTTRISVPGRGEVDAVLIMLTGSWGDWAALVIPCKGQEQKSGDLYV